jgi:uncharacterized protein DUF3433
MASQENRDGYGVVSLQNLEEVREEVREEEENRGEEREDREEDRDEGRDEEENREAEREDRGEDGEEGRDEEEHREAGREDREEDHEDNVDHADEEQKPSPTTPQTEEKKSKEYRSWEISWWMMSIVIFIEISLIVTIICLERISATRNGIAPVPQISASSGSPLSISNIWTYGLLWTALPSFVMSAYRIMWEAVVYASATRQPFVELAKSEDEAANAKLTIMLDYRSIAAYRSWWDAFCNGHFHLGFAMVITFVISLAVVPLTAHLFVSVPSISNSTVPLSSNFAFNDSAVTALSNLQPAFDLATAIRTYGSPPPGYMTPEYAFVPLDTVNLTSGNVTVPTHAYSAYLDCQEVTDTSSGYSVVFDPSAGGAVTVSFSDRGCNIAEQNFPVVSNAPRYAVSWYSTCPGQQYNRIGVFMGEYSSSSPIHLDPFTIISCSPLYSLTYGSLTISLQQDRGPQFVSFATQNSTSIRPFLYQVLESTLHSYSFFDPSNTFHGDSFGFYTYSYALKLNSTAPYAPSILISAIGNYFTTMYASLANTMLFTPAVAQSVTATISTTSTRLFVVTPVAYSIVGVLFLALICTIILFIYASKGSILREHPIGLLGSAVLVQGSGLEAFMREFREKHDISEVTKYVNKHYTVDKARCFADEKGRVVVNGLTEKEASTNM